MKLNLLSFAALSLLCSVAGTASLHGQVILNPNQISGTLRFSNANAAILNLLKSPGNEGMSNVVVLANSVPPAPPIAAYSDVLPATSRTVSAYQLTVDSANPGIAYLVTPYAVMQGDQYIYWFNPQTSAPVVIGTAPPPEVTNCTVTTPTHSVKSSGGGVMPITTGAEVLVLK